MTDGTPDKVQLHGASLTEIDAEEVHWESSSEKDSSRSKFIIHGCLFCILLLPLMGGVLYLILDTPEPSRLSQSIGALEGVPEGNSNDVVFQPSIMIQLSKDDEESDYGSGTMSSMKSRASLSNFDYGANSFMTVGQSIQQDTRIGIKSGGRNYYLQHQSDGNLVLYDESFKVYWHSGLIQGGSSKQYWTSLQRDGNLVTYSRINNGGPQAEWASNSASSTNQNYNVVLSPDRNGLMIVGRSNGQIIWSTASPAPAPTPSSQTSPTPAPPPPSSTSTNDLFLKQGQAIARSQRLTLSSRGIYLEQQSDGNLVLYNLNGQPIWSSRVNQSSSNFRTVLQADGNLVTLSDSGSVVWSSGSSTQFNGEYSLMCTPNADGLMIARPIDGNVVWSTVSVDPLPPLSPWPRTVRRSRTYELQSGPLVGHTTHNTAKIWVYLGRYVRMELVYWPYSSNGVMNSVNTVNLNPDSNANGAAFRTIEGLNADTTYLYEVRINDEWIAQGHFKTAPRPNRGTSFKYLLASCMNVKSYNAGYVEQPVWYEALKRSADFVMLPGDTVYLNNADFTSSGEVRYDRVWFRNLEQRAEKYFAHLIKTVPTYSQWDNNDYGSQTADRDQKGKWNSLSAWAHLWANPYQGSSRGAGNYYSYSWGDVDFFVMDPRWYRNDAGGILFGNAQLDWLSEKLIASTAKFKIIVSSTNVLEVGMVRDAHTIGKIITQHRISGVLFNTGDIHRNQFTSQNVAFWPYPVMQITSSGIGKVWRRPFAMISVNTQLQNPEILVEFYAADNPARFTTWSNKPNRECRGVDINDEHGMSKCTQRIRLSELTPR